MDYEEFCLATNNNYEILKKIAASNQGLGESTNRKLMRDLRIYMAVGGMPQAVDAYIRGANFTKIDFIKRQIISLYEDDFKKLILLAAYLPYIILFQHNYLRIQKNIEYLQH